MKMNKHIATILILLIGFAALLGGCANARYSAGIDLACYGDTILISNISHVAQSKEYPCGYASLASVALYYQISSEQLTGDSFKKAFGKRGLSARDLKAFGQALGLVAFAYKGDIENLKGNLRKKRPVLVLLGESPRIANWPSYTWAKETAGRSIGGPHWVVVIGINTRTDEIIIQDPLRGCLVMSSGAFLKSWEKKSCVAVLLGIRG
jgi:ABC-type bacteriocin/lantibiotic exporter with double-glycine peptidase domain